MPAAPLPPLPTADPVLAGYRTPGGLVLDKVIDHLDAHCREFIAHSPFATLSTADAEGWPDVSPRGGDPGFVHVLDERRLLLPDRPGNNRVDSLRNVAVNPRAALMFLVPGVEQTLRVYGTATLVAPEELPVDLTEFGRAPLSVLVLDVRRAYFQCPKSVMRSGLWDPARQVAPTALTPFGRVIRDHCALEDDLPDDATIRASLAEEL
ncbi:MSMEG_1061 family FMN-dependent PPOX-type flavoprotein [Blastococcus sp. VKM Ac-2987]|uniref:MSMEG_1061 family FMN-dependent PPOX-type flavoprotein n=1 Tax=Blastococcus sp. VKM Ac-2987 TaxID=3004141 RepID=UPI0022AB745D|nr:MSMEG_1061 family FMN-dependent PPOX-type flavoprotein [Blastococcus sp. VKM Ac-2987]MCZ2858337.1 pyridoxamine 5'-phosphate oxidase family protein [Blastococcus sp. VKM Ac-2987]